MKKLSFYLSLILLVSILSCNQERVDVRPLPKSSDPSFSIENRPLQPLLLGEQLENPYSVENMRKALDFLKSDLDQAAEAGIRTKSINEIAISATDLYVRMRPSDSTAYTSLVFDSTLCLFLFPLDYEIKQQGDYFIDATNSGKYPWYYTTVKPNYKSIEGVDYEILAELFIPENSEYYTEEDITDSIELTKSTQSRVLDNDFVTALTVASFRLTGNESQIRTPQEDIRTRVTETKCKTKKFLWKTWTSCDDTYYPDGYIKMQTPGGIVPVKGVKVRMKRWFSVADAYTDENGYYKSTEKWGSLLIGNNMDYHIVFDGKFEYKDGAVNKDRRWTFSKSLAGALCFWTNWYDAGLHHPNGHSVTFYTNSGDWGRCVLQNAVYDYHKYALKEGITLPPDNMDIANQTNSNLSSSAPLLKSHINFSLIYGSPVWGTIGTVYGYVLCGWGLPDLILRFNNEISRYNEMVSTAWHELSHGSHLEAMKKYKNFYWASDYWSLIIRKEVMNGTNSASVYGKKGDEGWEQIALAEGWAYYREWYLSKEKLGYNSLLGYKFDNYSFYRNGAVKEYGGMFDKLFNAGCSMLNLEKCVASSYSIAGFKNDLIKCYPSKFSQIANIIITYE